MVKGPMTGRPTRGTTQGGQPSDVPGGHPARLYFQTGDPVAWSHKTVTYEYDISELEPDGETE